MMRSPSRSCRECGKPIPKSRRLCPSCALAYKRAASVVLIRRKRQDPEYLNAERARNADRMRAWRAAQGMTPRQPREHPRMTANERYRTDPVFRERAKAAALARHQRNKAKPPAETPPGPVALPPRATAAQQPKSDESATERNTDEIAAQQQRNT